MTDTPNLGLTYVEAAQSQKHVPVNEAFRSLDVLVQPTVKDKDLTAPPGSPANGDAYIVGAGATGAWAGHADDVAAWYDNAWFFFPPKAGWVFYVQDESTDYAYSGSAWAPNAPGTITVSDVGFTLQDNADATKQLKFELSDISTGTTRKLTVPNATGTIALLSGTQTFSGNTTFSGTLTASNATVTLGTATTATTVGLGTGAITSGVSKTVNLGTGGLSGSTTTIEIGSSVSGALGVTNLRSPTVFLDGTVLNGPTIDATFDKLGLGGASPDATNKFAFYGTNLLLNSGGSIDLTYNKNAAANDASLSFKTGFSTRAIVGTLGDDNLHLRVSPNGSTFYDALVIDRNTGKTSHLAGLRCVPMASDPASPVDGDIWYNSTGARLKTRIDGRTMTLGDDEVPSIVAATNRYFTANTMPGTTTTTLDGVADRMNIYPFIPKFDFTANQLAIKVTTLIAGALCKIVVYDSDENGRPDQRITETGDLDCSTTGDKIATVSIAFKKGKQYWLGVRSSSTATISAFQPHTSPNLDMTSISTKQTKTLQRTLAYATAAPATWTYVATEASTTAAPAIWFRSA